MQYTFHPTCQLDPVVLDRIFQETFGCKTDGVFVECGAYDGKSYSNTWGLARCGWRGLYIEPDPDNCALCSKEHGDGYPRIGLAMCAVGDHNATDVPLFQAGWGSALSKNAYMEVSKEITTTLRTLDYLLPRWQIEPGFDLLVIDVEFHESDVLKGFTLEEWKPKLVIIELHEENRFGWTTELSKPHAEFANKYFAEKYDKLYFDHINTIFRRKP